MKHQRFGSLQEKTEARLEEVMKPVSELIVVKDGIGLQVSWGQNVFPSSFLQSNLSSCVSFVKTQT